MTKLLILVIACLTLLFPVRFVTRAQRMQLISLPVASQQNISNLSVFHTSLSQKIVIEKADSKVSQADIQDVSFLLQHYSIPTLTVNIHHNVNQTLYVRLFESKRKFESNVKKYFALAYKARDGIVLNGFAHGTTAFIPMYKYKYQQSGKSKYANSSLANYLTHELTHVIFNAEHVSIPVWVNEGFAWYNGISAETKFNASQSTQLANSNYYNLDYAAQTRSLVPLPQNEGEIFRETKYNLEFEDFAAVSELISDYGLQQFREFVFLTSSESANQAYRQTYHSSIAAYEQFFYEYTNNE